MKIDEFVRLIANMTKYKWSEAESWTDDQAEDALVCMNRLIGEARKLKVPSREADEVLLIVPHKTVTVMRNALGDAIIRAALDKRTEARKAFEAAKEDLNAAVVRNLPDEPSNRSLTKSKITR